MVIGKSLLVILLWLQVQCWTASSSTTSEQDCEVDSSSYLQRSVRDVSASLQAVRTPEGEEEETHPAGEEAAEEEEEEEEHPGGGEEEEEEEESGGGEEEEEEEESGGLTSEKRVHTPTLTMAHINKGQGCSYTINLISSASFAICSAWVMVVAYTQCHMLAALDRSLDCWCFNMAADPNFDDGVLSWNRLQAACWLNNNGKLQLEPPYTWLPAVQVLGAVGLVYCLASGIMAFFQFNFASDKVFREVLSLIPLLFLFGLNMTDSRRQARNEILSACDVPGELLRVGEAAVGEAVGGGAMLCNCWAFPGRVQCDLLLGHAEL
eukprot:Skav223128  [mRNA]  locus=scaffold470:65205:92653:+ [translate_table: standard]